MSLLLDELQSLSYKDFKATWGGDLSERKWEQVKEIGADLLTGDVDGAVSRALIDGALPGYFAYDDFRATGTSIHLPIVRATKGTWRARNAVTDGSGALYSVLSATGLNSMVPFGSGYGFYEYSIIPSRANYSAFATVRNFTDDSASGVGVIVRMNYTGTKGILAGYSNVTKAWHISKANTDVTVLDSELATLALDTEYEIELKAEGYYFTLYVNGVQKCQVIDTSFTEAGFIGVYGFGTGASVTEGVHLRKFWGMDGSTVKEPKRKVSLFLTGESHNGSYLREFGPTTLHWLLQWLEEDTGFTFALDGKSFQTIATEATTLTTVFPVMARAELKIVIFASGIPDMALSARTSEQVAADALTSVNYAFAAGADFVFVLNAMKTAASTGNPVTPGTPENERLDYNASDLPTALLGTGATLINTNDNAAFSDYNNSLYFTQLTDLGATDKIHMTTLGQYVRTRQIYDAIIAAITKPKVRIRKTVSSATPAINVDITEQFEITALALAITSLSSGLTGTPVDGQILRIRYKDDGSDRAITHGASFRSCVATMLSTTTAGKISYETFCYNAADTVWDCMLAGTQA